MKINNPRREKGVSYEKIILFQKESYEKLFFTGIEIIIDKNE